MRRETVYEFAGGEPAFLALATAHHARCLADPELNHPFSHPGHPEHVQRLARYWGEVFGGPAWFSENAGGHPAARAMHSGQGSPPEWEQRFTDCFVQAMDDAGLPSDPELRRVLREYMEWAAADMMADHAEAAGPMPRWTWTGLAEPA